MTPALRVNYGTGLLCIHYVPNVGAFFLLNQFPEPLQLHIALAMFNFGAAVDVATDDCLFMAGPPDQ